MFCVYSTVPTINTSEVVKTLNLGIFGNFTDGEQWAPSTQSFLNRPISTIVQHHRTSPGDFNKTYFVVADRLDWHSEGVLAVNLNFEGFIDAVRMQANVAGSALPSTNIANTDWHEAIPDAKSGLYPRGRFAVYASEAVADVSTKGGLLESLNFGLESRKACAAAVCRMALVRRCDVDWIAHEHARVAAEEGFDQEIFIIVDDVEWEEHGLEIGQVKDRKVDTAVRPVDVAAEVLTWVHQGLISWEEAKKWDDEKIESEA